MPFRSIFPSKKLNQTSPDGRFTINWTYDQHDSNDVVWTVTDNTTGKVIREYYDDITRVTVKRVAFDKTGLCIVVKNGLGKVLEKLDLSEFE